jgi:hypothetical protein
MQGTSFAIVLAAATAATACTSDPSGPSGPSDPPSTDPTELILVTASGADVGACTPAAPCRTLQYALRQVTAERAAVRVDAARLDTASSIVIERPVAIAAPGTEIVQHGDAPTFIIAAFVSGVTIDGAHLRGTGALEPAIIVGAGSTLRLSGAVLDSASISVEHGALELRGVKLTTSRLSFEAVRCSGGVVRVRGADFEHTTLTTEHCDLEVSRSRFHEVMDGSIAATGGVAVIENNLVVQAYELADSMFLTEMEPGSTVRFNTFVNTSGVASDGVALYCDDTLHVTSNIFAYGSKHPLGPPLFRCPATFSLFDEVAVVEQAAGEGNLIANAQTFFVDRAAGDFHPARNSPAKNAAEPGLAVTEDLEGNRRSAPLGTVADIGALEGGECDLDEALRDAS